MRRRLIGLMSAITLAFTSSPVLASTANTGSGTAQFLSMGAGARALGLGDAFGPVAEGPEAIYWNPAGLNQLSEPQILYSHVETLRFFHHDFAAYARPVPGLDGTLGASLTGFYQDSLPLVTNANQTAGSFTPNSEAVSIAYAHSFLGENPLMNDLREFRRQYNAPWAEDSMEKLQGSSRGSLMTGLALKVIHESLADRSASAFAIDGGMLYRLSWMNELRLSFAFHNIGSQEKFINEAENLPMEIDLGAAYDYNMRGDHRRLLPAFELALPYYGSPSAKLGLEYATPVGENIIAAMRMGYKTLTADLNPLSGLTVGAGIKYKRASFDFGFEPMSQLGEVYRLSFNLAF